MTPIHRNSKPSPSLKRILGVCAAMSVPALWVSGILGNALSLEATAAFTVALILLCAMIPQRRLDATLTIITLITSISLTLCVADTALRLFAGPLVYYRAHSELVRQDSKHPGLTRYVPNARSDRSTFGDLAAMLGDPRHRVQRREVFETDERGFRTSTRDRERPFDLIILGDSFGMGLGSTQEETWTSLLEHNGHHIYNLSMPATCPAHGAARLALELPSLALTENATVIVPVYVGNDLEECTQEIDAKLSAESPSSLTSARIAIDDYQSRSPLRQFAMRLVYRWLFADPVVTARDLPDGASMLFYKPHVRAAQLSVNDVQHSPNFLVLTKALSRIQTISQKHHLAMVVVILPTKEEIYGWMLRNGSPDPAPQNSSPFAQAITTFCASQKIASHDLTPQFMDAANSSFKNGKLLWWRDDSHWNHTGHDVASRLISQALKTK